MSMFEKKNRNFLKHSHFAFISYNTYKISYRKIIQIKNHILKIIFITGTGLGTKSLSRKI